MRALQILTTIYPYIPELIHYLPEGPAQDVAGLVARMALEVKSQPITTADGLQKAEQLALTLLLHFAKVLPGTGPAGTAIGLIIELLPHAVAMASQERVRVIYADSPDLHPPELV